jgi:hypothetical protein
MRYREYETQQSLLREHQAAARIAQHWQGRVLPAEQYECFDRRLVTSDGRTAALVEIKWRNYDLQYMVEHHYLLSLSKVRSLRQAAKQRQCVPLVMVCCTDDDFLLDLRDETGQSIRRLPLNDRWYDERTGATQMREEHMVAFAGGRFIPLFAIGDLL